MTTNNSYDALLTLYNTLVGKVDSLTDQVARLTEQVSKISLWTSENASKPKAKSSKAPGGSNPVGLDPSTGEPEKKFPSNTINWIKYKVVKDNNFLKNVLRDAYPKLESKHAETLKSKNLTGDAYQRQLAQLIWTDIVNNSKNAGSEEVKKQCLFLIKWFKDTWTKENEAFLNELKSTSAPTSVVGGVSIPEATLSVPNGSPAEHTSSEHVSVSPSNLFSNHGLPANLTFAPVNLGLPLR